VSRERKKMLKEVYKSEELSLKTAVLNGKKTIPIA